MFIHCLQMLNMDTWNKVWPIHPWTKCGLTIRFFVRTTSKNGVLIRFPFPFSNCAMFRRVVPEMDHLSAVRPERARHVSEWVWLTSRWPPLHPLKQVCLVPLNSCLCRRPQLETFLKVCVCSALSTSVASLLYLCELQVHLSSVSPFVLSDVGFILLFRHVPSQL